MRRTESLVLKNENKTTIAMPARRDTFKYHNCRNTQTFNFATSVQVSVLKKKATRRYELWTTTIVSNMFSYGGCSPNSPSYLPHRTWIVKWGLTCQRHRSQPWWLCEDRSASPSLSTSCSSMLSASLMKRSTIQASKSRINLCQPKPAAGKETDVWVGLCCDVTDDSGCGSMSGAVLDVIPHKLTQEPGNFHWA